MKTFAYFMMLTATFGALTACQPAVEQALPPEAEPAGTHYEPSPEPSVKTQASRSNPAPQTEPQRVSTAQSTTAPAPIQPMQPARRSTPKILTPFPVKRCMNMGNWLEAPNEGEWGQNYGPADFANIKRSGFDTVRIPVRWDSHMQRRAPYTVDAAYMRRIKRAVSDAQRARLGVVLDVHHYNDLIDNPRREKARFVALWDQISDAFAGAPNTVYFEILNEPTDAISMAQTNDLYATVIPRIRKTHPRRILIIGGNRWNSIDTISQVDFPDDPNVIATFHDYGPHAFTHQGTPWSHPVQPIGRVWGGEADKAELSLTYNDARAFQKNTGRRIFIGEFGVYNIVPQEQRNLWIKTRRKAMEANGYAWCAWDYTGAFSLYDKTSKRWQPGALDALMGR